MGNNKPTRTSFKPVEKRSVSRSDKCHSCGRLLFGLTTAIHENIAAGICWVFCTRACKLAYLRQLSSTNDCGAIMEEKDDAIH